MNITTEQIQAALTAANGDLVQAAAALGVSHRWLRATALRRGLISE